MSDIGVAEIPVDEEERPLPPPEPPVRNALVDGRILPTLLQLAWPNALAFSAGTCVVIAETSYIGRLGVESLAAMALVFPFVMLTMTMSGGAVGGRGNVLAQAISYVQIFFGGAVLPWLLNSFAGILRGTGNMKLPSAMFLNAAFCQIVLGGSLGLGIGPIPQFGMRGVAAGTLIAYTISVSVMGWYLFSGRARVVPKIRGLRIQGAIFFDILKV